MFLYQYFSSFVVRVMFMDIEFVDITKFAFEFFELSGYFEPSYKPKDFCVFYSSCLDI